MTRPLGSNKRLGNAVLLTLSLLGCAHAPGASSSGPDAGAVNSAGHLALSGLVDVACSADDCRALAHGGLFGLPGGAPLPSPPGLDGFDTLRVTDGAWEVEGACAEGRCARSVSTDPPALGPPRPAGALAPPLDDGSLSFAAAAEAFVGAWNAGAPKGWRSGFSRVIVGPGGGPITWLRSGEGAGQLMRAGPGSRSIAVGATPSPVTWPGWLAMHPTGQEAYLVAWPSPWVRAFDPATLASHWTLPVEGAAQGLFVDPLGRFLLVGVGSDHSDRLVDWSLPALTPVPTEDPARDEVIRAVDRPEMAATLVIDLATHAVCARAEGHFRRWLNRPEHPLLVTDHEVVTLTPGDPPS